MYYGTSETHKINIYSTTEMPSHMPTTNSPPLKSSGNGYATWGLKSLRILELYGLNKTMQFFAEFTENYVSGSIKTVLSLTFWRVEWNVTTLNSHTCATFTGSFRDSKIHTNLLISKKLKDDLNSASYSFLYHINLIGLHRGNTKIVVKVHSRVVPWLTCSKKLSEFALLNCNNWQKRITPRYVDCTLSK